MSKAPLYALQAFVAIARAQNLTRAAERLNLTVSALSHQMRGLEERLDRRLLERLPRGVKLTTEGQRLLDAVGPHVEAIERALAQRRVRADDTVAVSAMPSVASGWLIPRLPKFAAAHPEIQLSVSSSISLVDFESEPIDAALRFGPGAWPGVVAEHLFDEWMTPLASPDLIRRLGKPKLAELGKWPLLGDPNERWKEWFAQFGGTAPRRYVAQFSDSEMPLRAAAEGMGITLGRLTIAHALLEAGRLVRLTPKQLHAQYAHYLVYPSRSADHKGLQVFKAWLHDEARRHTALRNAS